MVHQKQALRVWKWSSDRSVSGSETLLLRSIIHTIMDAEKSLLPFSRLGKLYEHTLALACGCYVAPLGSTHWNTL